MEEVVITESFVLSAALCFPVCILRTQSVIFVQELRHG